MMFIDHVAAGCMIGATFGQAEKKRAVFLGIACSLAPDVDIIWSGAPGTVSYLEFHRVGSHSVFSLPIILILLFVLRSVWKNPLFGTLSGSKSAVIVSLSFLSHLLLDLIPPYGVPLLYPLSNARFSLDLLHDLDPIFLGISLLVVTLTVLTVWRNRFRQGIVLLALLFLYVGYVSYAAIEKMSLERSIQESHGGKTVHLFPRTFWRWKAIREEKGVWQVFSISNGLVVNQKLFPRNDLTTMGEVLNDHCVQVYLAFARFPVVYASSDSSLVFMNLVYSEENYKMTVSLTEYGRVKDCVVTSFDLSDID